MAINFSDYVNGDLIPADTIAPVQIRITTAMEPTAYSRRRRPKTPKPSRRS